MGIGDAGKPDFSFVSLALHRRIRHTPLASLQHRKIMHGAIYRVLNAGLNDTYSYSASLSLRQIVQDDCSSWKSTNDCRIYNLNMRFM